MINWDGENLAEAERRHDQVNSCINVLPNFGGFMYVGIIMPWSEFNDPDGTGLTYGRLILLGVLVLLFRRIPAILLSYKLMLAVVKGWREALFMDYFGPIVVGAVFYLEHSRHLFPKLGEGDEETNLAKAIGPVVYWLVLFSIVVHGVSIPALNLIYTYMGVKPIQEDAVEIRRASMGAATPVNAVPGDKDTFIAYNRFGRPVFDPSTLPVAREQNYAYPGCANDSMCPSPGGV
ncbi:Na(+)/H(+) antiporter 2 [Tolypocladium ophioglossoides CBS 100239]|uniref:Na(+)/H(+) antiporter 2 n=1 Tax=Tolypocladium ophioglossoides (strain CBS 100239) TaxID=1163406 RepID=A0A0L0MYC9_TOLOC|nr:Na(+)/H(+) antiporter 2 [Tolypocladium ophioglossoides CBS 100239]